MRYEIKLWYHRKTRIEWAIVEIGYRNPIEISEGSSPVTPPAVLVTKLNELNAAYLPA